MKTLICLITLIVFWSCSHHPLQLRQEVNHLYNSSENHHEICPLMDKSVTRGQAAYCLGWIYLKETNQKFPDVDWIGFQDIHQGHIHTPYIWVVIVEDIMESYNFNKFGYNSPITIEKWEHSVEKMKIAIKKSKKNVPRIVK